MSSKRKQGATELSGREKKKQKTALARTIAVQGSANMTTNQAPVASSSKSVSFQGTKALPGSLDVERFAEARAFEINAMHSAMESARSGATHRAWQQLPRHLRRRAASHDVRRVPLRLRDKARAEMDAPKAKQTKKHIPRRGKEKRVPRTKMFQARQRDKTWLETHIWHAKRMHMENLWGYRLAITPTEKSFRPSHRASVHASIIHDASYFGLIELKGPDAVLKSILNRCCDCQGTSPGAQRFLNGTRAFDTHFYKRDSYPLGLIAPVRMLWKPACSSEQPEKQAEAAGGPTPSKPGKNKGKAKAVPDRTKPESSSQRIVWIWVHPSVFDEIYVELQVTASYVLEAVKANSAPSDGPTNVELSDLRGHVNIFEIMGPKASQVIHGALKPVLNDEREDFKECWAALANLQSTASIPRNVVIGFKVNDPRLTFPPKNTKVSIDNEKLPSQAAHGTSFYPTSSLARTELWDEEVRRPLVKPKYKKADIDARRSKNLVPGTNLHAQHQDDRIPVMLIQRSIETSSESDQGPNTSGVHGWTLIIPAGWSMAFFSSLIFTGTRVGGQRERETQMFEAGCPSFPRDYPTTDTYDDFVEDRGEQEQERWERKPKSKRPNYHRLNVRSPWKPDWDIVLGLKDQEPVVAPEQRGDDEDTSEDDFLPAQRVAVELQSDEEMGGDEPQPEANNEIDTADEDLENADNEQIKEKAQEEPKEQILQTDREDTWLVRGIDIPNLLGTLVSSSQSSRPTLLLELINALRGKRTLPELGKGIQEQHFNPMTAEDVYKRALVRVGMRMYERGSPSEMAMIYAMSDDEVCRLRKRERRQGDQDDEMDDWEDEGESVTIPPSEGIIGYVLTGNFSLSIGVASAIGAIPLSQLIAIKEQSIRLGYQEMVVKVRDRHETICRPARLTIITT